MVICKHAERRKKAEPPSNLLGRQSVVPAPGNLDQDRRANLNFDSNGSRGILEEEKVRAGRQGVDDTLTPLTTTQGDLSHGYPNATTPSNPSKT
jgi:hypothetical protein